MKEQSNSVKNQIEAFVSEMLALLDGEEQRMSDASKSFPMDGKAARKA